MERASIEKKPANDEPSAINVDMADSAVTESENQKKIEAVIRHKFDRRVLPAGIIIFLMGQIDRSNMSNAAVLGMEEDLGLVGSQFNEALSLFFVTYILFEIPANFLCKRMGPRIWLSFITFGFGVVTMGMAFITNRASLLACRLLLGLFEAGIQPGLMFAYSQFYRRHEMASRWGIKAAGASLSGAFGGLLGGGLGSLPKRGILVRWRWIFLIEGLMTLAVAGWTYWVMPNSIAMSSFLTEEEKAVATRRIDEENKMIVGSEDRSPWRWDIMKKAVWNANTQLVSLGIMMSLLALTSLSLFMPSLLRSMGYTPIQSQLLTVPPYTLAAIVCLVGSFTSDRLKTRGLVMLVLTPLTMIGFILMATVPSTAVRYFALFLSTSAAFTCSPILLAWIVSNSAGPSVRAVVAAYAVGEGNLGSIIATWTYPRSDAPRYINGHFINFGAACILFIVLAVTTLYLRRENKLRAAGGRDYRLENATEEEKWLLGHSHPEYRYTA